MVKSEKKRGLTAITGVGRRIYLLLCSRGSLIYKKAQVEVTCATEPETTLFGLCTAYLRKCSIQKKIVCQVDHIFCVHCAVSVHISYLQRGRWIAVDEYIIQQVNHVRNVDFPITGDISWKKDEEVIVVQLLSDGTILNQAGEIQVGVECSRIIGQILTVKRIHMKSLPDYVG
jgi:hypothetical protein